MHRKFPEDTIPILKRWQLAKERASKGFVDGFIDTEAWREVWRAVYLLKPKDQVQGRKWQKTMLENKMKDDGVEAWKLPCRD